MHKSVNKNVEKMVDLFKALGDRVRLRIIRLLASKMEKRICVIDLAKKIEISQPSASQHLKVLKNVDILTQKKVGNKIFYSINTMILKNYKNLVDEMFELAFEKCEGYKNCEECENYRNSECL